MHQALAGVLDDSVSPMSRATKVLQKINTCAGLILVMFALIHYVQDAVVGSVNI